MGQNIFMRMNCAGFDLQSRVNPNTDPNPMGWVQLPNPNEWN